MAENSRESVVFIASGAIAGAEVSATIGTMGLVGGFGGVAIGVTPVTVAGAVAGAAAYGAFKAIEEGDAWAFGALGIGAAGGAGVSATIGGMGLAGSFGAVGIGMGSMAAAGGVVGLGVYGLYQAFNQKPGQRMAGAIDAFGQMESKVLGMEAYNQALLELELGALTKNLLGDAVAEKFDALEVEVELEALKAKKSKQAESTSYSATNTQTSANQFINPENQAKIIATNAQQSQRWQCLKVLKQHQGKVNSIAISSDGQTLASGSDDRTVSLWNLKTGKHDFTFFGQRAEVLAVAISPKVKLLVAGGFDNKITSWHLDTKVLLCPFLYLNYPYSHSGCISCLTFSADGKILASASGDQTIRLWGRDTGELKRTLNAHSDMVLSVAISPDGQTIASASADQTIRLWSLNSYEQPRIIRGHSGWVTAVAINPDGNILASSSTDGTVKLWHIKTGQLIKTLDQQSTGVFAVAISSDGEIMASAGTKTVKLWNLRTGKQLCTLAGCSPIAFSPQGKTLVSGGDKGTIKIWSQILGTDESILELSISGEWWEVLGVGRDANMDTVKLAYRQLARQYHPDLNRTQAAITKMQAINQAYEAFLQEFSRAWGG